MNTQKTQKDMNEYEHVSSYIQKSMKPIENKTIQKHIRTYGKIQNIEEQKEKIEIYKKCWNVSISRCERYRTTYEHMKRYRTIQKHIDTHRNTYKHIPKHTKTYGIIQTNIKLYRKV